ncbi:sugar phosphate isomerase/epimerase [Pseudomonas sp. B21-040]|uniref:sugar phosphate isomerase/epimerase family protein n=1 Tax=Pseudomonas sp. B21-040 TaxID=2895486 RepID=UPI0021608E18|nr:sugar phosphate isomerase/epimerase [Pseudomonas sp. B21-040]UVL38911.1 sugar phosphate isomerase/epimerase [Pseudomonas sp. B21-040]
MRLAISNIAWDVSEDNSIAELLVRHEIDAIDIAPGKYFQYPEQASDTEILFVKDWWCQRNIKISGMQALLFGTTGLNVFGSSHSRDCLIKHIASVCRIGAGIGAKHLVFGSPKNRDRSGIKDDAARRIAVDVFKAMGDVAASHGVTVCLEPNPPCYGANFMTTSLDTADVVRAVAHKNIKMQLDIGALTINQESAADILEHCAELIGHVHISEPNLVPIGDLDTKHEDIAAAVLKHLPDHTLTIEMLATTQESHIQSVERAIKVASSYYRAPKKVPKR